MTDTVRLEFAADTENVALARSVAARMATRADFALDRVEDARLAVDEAVTQVISTETGGPVTCIFTLETGSLVVEVSAPSPAMPDQDSFGWIVLRALVDEVEAVSSGSSLTLVLRMAGSVPAHP